MEQARLSPPEELTREVVAACKPALESRAVSEVEAMVERVDQIASRESDALDTYRTEPLACHPGCAHCCYRVIRCTIPEVIRIAEVVGRSFSQEEREQLAHRLYQYEREVVPNFGLDVQTLRPACPLLVGERCTVYEARPLVCRAMNSTDASACKAFKDHPERQVPIPIFRPRLQMTQAVAMAVNRACLGVKLKGGPHDLGRALKIALDSPDAAESWLAGEQPFHPALTEETAAPSLPKPLEVNHQSYQPGLEPLGNFDESGLGQFFYYLSRGESGRADDSIRRKSHPGYRLAQIRMPGGYRDAEDVWHWRTKFQTRLREFAESKFDPKEAYDGLSVFRYHELSYQQFNNREILAEIGDLLCNRIAAQALPDLSAPIEGPRKPGRIRIGYVGYDLRESSLAPWTLGWLKHRSPEFETFAINVGEIQDSVTKKFEQLADHYHHLPRTGPVPQDARFIKSLDLDVLVVLDAGTKARTNQLACLRLARVQCAAWGASESTGMPTIDYHLTGDLLEIPEAQEHYTENLVRLPRAGVCYLRESGRASQLEKRDFGIESGPLIVSVQPACKFDPQWDHLYREINAATRQPIVIVQRAGQDQTIVRERLERNGVRAKFIRQLSLPDYRGLLNIADVLLDTPGWNGGITTIQALDAQKPVVTLPTELRRGRQSLCLLGLANAPKLVAKDPADYVDLATHPDRLREATQYMDPKAMYEDVQALRAMESFFQSVVS